MSTGTLYLVSTPIGNLEDITLRALRVLREVSRIACEDTRQTRKLLVHHGLSTPTLSFHRFNERRAATGIVRRLLAGEDIALVTDGGTPSVSDPGLSLVRAALEADLRVVPVPGPSALLAAVVASGLPVEGFSFFGFLPHRSGERQRRLVSLRDRPETLIFFDSPRRVGASLAEMAEIFGDRAAALGREITKRHEEFRRGSLRDLAEGLRGQEVRGEVTLLVAGAAPPAARTAVAPVLRAEVEEKICREGRTTRDAVDAVARARKIPRQLVYRALRDSERPGQEDGDGE